MTPEEYEAMLQSQALQGQVSQNNLNNQQQLLFQEQERGLAEEQLDVEEIIERIYNLLQGKEYVEVSPGVKDWKEPKDSSSKVLSDWGIQRIMQIVRFHINKNTLLSNFGEEEINRIMFDFTRELNDLMLLKYKQLLREPTFAECRAIIEKRMADKKQVRMFAIEVLGKKPDEIKITKEITAEIEGRIEREIQKIRNEQLSERIKEYGMLLWEIEQSVYSTYNRAYEGRERETLRRHASFSEIRAMSPEQKKLGGPFSWFPRN